MHVRCLLARNKRAALYATSEMSAFLTIPWSTAVGPSCLGSPTTTAQFTLRLIVRRDEPRVKTLLLTFRNAAAIPDMSDDVRHDLSLNSGHLATKNGEVPNELCKRTSNIEHKTKTHVFIEAMSVLELFGALHARRPGIVSSKFVNTSGGSACQPRPQILRHISHSPFNLCHELSLSRVARSGAHRKERLRPPDRALLSGSDPNPAFEVDRCRSRRHHRRRRGCIHVYDAAGTFYARSDPDQVNLRVPVEKARTVLPTHPLKSVILPPMCGLACWSVFLQGGQQAETGRKGSGPRRVKTTV